MESAVVDAIFTKQPFEFFAGVDSSDSRRRLLDETSEAQATEASVPEVRTGDSFSDVINYLWTRLEVL